MLLLGLPVQEKRSAGILSRAEIGYWKLRSPSGCEDADLYG